MIVLNYMICSYRLPDGKSKTKKTQKKSVILIQTTNDCT